MSEAQHGLLKTESSKPSIQNYGEQKTNYLASNEIIKESTPQPHGQRFTLDAQYKTPAEECMDCGCGDPRLIICGLIVMSGFSVGAWACFASGYILYGALILLPWVLVIVLILYLCGCCESKESTLERWKLTTIIPLDQIRSISANCQKRTRGYAETEDAYVVIKLSISPNREIKMNSKSARIIDVKDFVATIDKYLEQIGDKYRNAAMAINNVDEALKGMIRSLKSSDNSEYKMKGMKLDYWYEMKKESIVNEFINLLKQTKQNENQWTHDQRKEYILTMLMSKCETLENIKSTSVL